MITIPRPDDWHVHLRDDLMLDAVVAHTARRYRYGLVMPNLRPPLITLAAIGAYRDRIVAAAQRAQAATGDPHWDFRPVFCFFASPEIPMADLRQGTEEGLVMGVKFYPSGATTNSDQAVSDLDGLNSLFETMQGIGARLFVHAESTRTDVDLFDREEAFLHDELAPVMARFPELGVTVEHVSTRAGIDFVRAHPQSAATITPHHLARNRGDMLASGMRPDLYCKPVINSPSDQQALIEAVATSQTQFLLGTDSAPHPSTAKYGPSAAAGVFTAPYGIEVVAEVLYRAGALEHLGAFVSDNGCAHYGVERPTEHLRLTRHSTPRPSSDLVETLQTEDGDEVVFFGMEEAAYWSIQSA